MSSKSFFYSLGLFILIPDSITGNGKFPKIIVWRKRIDFKIFHAILMCLWLLQLLNNSPCLKWIRYSRQPWYSTEYFGSQILGYLSRKPVCVGQNKQGTVNLVYFHGCEEETLPRCTCFGLFAPCQTALSRATNGKIDFDRFREIK